MTSTEVAQPKTWELIAEVKQPMRVSELEILVEEGRGLHFPLHRSYEMNLLNDNWNKFIVSMALEKKQDLLEAMAKGDEKAFAKAVKHVAGINSWYRLNSARIDGKLLRLDLGLTDFKEYIGTTQHALKDAEFRKRLMDAGIADANDPNVYFSNPLSSCTAIVTSDGYLPVGMRGKAVAIYPSVPHIIGGYVKVNGNNKPDFTVKDVDLFANMLKELREELAISQEEVASADFLGIVRNRITRGPEMMYLMKVALTASEVESRWKTKSKDKYEHRNITFYRKEDLPKFLRENEGKMVPSGEATLALYDKHYNS